MLIFHLIQPVYINKKVLWLFVICFNVWIPIHRGRRGRDRVCGNWIYNYLWNQSLSPPMLWARISIWARCTTVCDKAWLWLATGRWFSPGPPLSSTNETDSQYNWNIVESGVKHHQANTKTNQFTGYSSSSFLLQLTYM
jgi:hypothetical protein